MFDSASHPDRHPYDVNLPPLAFLGHDLLSTETRGLDRNSYLQRSVSIKADAAELFPAMQNATIVIFEEIADGDIKSTYLVSEDQGKFIYRSRVS